MTLSLQRELLLVLLTSVLLDAPAGELLRPRLPHRKQSPAPPPPPPASVPSASSVNTEMSCSL